jgi:hypothetical protein
MLQVLKYKIRSKSLIFILVLYFVILQSCKDPEVLVWNPNVLTDKSDVTITCDATGGNKGLLNYEGDVYVHLGLITNQSNNKEWRYVKFKWGSREINAKATPLGKNKWSYTIPTIRSFFGVNEGEKIISIAVLFRSGACIDVNCKALRNLDSSNMYIPITDESVK